MHFLSWCPHFSADVTEGCAPLQVEFKDESTGGASSWSWDMGDGLSSDANPKWTFINPGTYTIKLTVNGSKTITKQAYIKVYAQPVAQFTSTNVTGCFPWPVKFTDQSTTATGTITKWEWDFGDGSPFSNEKNPEHTYNSIGNYHVVLRVTNSNGCDDTEPKINYVKISTGARADFELSAPQNCNPPTTVNFIDKSEGVGTLTYEWNFGDGSPPSTEKILLINIQKQEPIL